MSIVSDPGKGFLVLFFFSLAFFTCEACNAEDPPNVLLILVDDLKPAIGAYSDRFAKTPKLDELAKSSVVFEKAYCNQAVCAASRFNLMLGSHSTSTGLYGLGNNLRQFYPDAITLPQYFSVHGYRTESLGKVFHIGHGNLGDPDSFSVPHFHDKVIEYVDPDSTSQRGISREEAYFENKKLGNIRLLPKGPAFESPDVSDEAYADGRVAAETVKRLRLAKRRRSENNTPFFIAAGFARPHLPFSVPKKYWDMFDPKDLPIALREKLPADSPEYAGKKGGEICNYSPVPASASSMNIELKRKLIHGYYASCAYVDAQIGKVLEELERLSLKDNTIVVLWGDHGFHLGDLGMWTKHTNYEQANRIPLLIRAPGISAGRTNQLVTSVDIYPTLVELAGLPKPKVPQPIDGISMVPVLMHSDHHVRDHAFHAFPKQRFGRAVRTQRYRLVEWTDNKGNVEYELFDYETDSVETKNLAKTKPGLVSELKEILAKYPPRKARVRKNRKQTSTQQTVDPTRRTATKPLFRDPNYEGSCDPEIVWNPKNERYYIYYTARRATRKQGTYVGTPIGVISSNNLIDWKFEGYCSFNGVAGQPDNSDTHWAPGVVVEGDEIHMFATYKDNATPPWGGKGTIRHYVTTLDEPLTGWKETTSPQFPQPDPIDVSVFKDNSLFFAFYRVGKGGGIQWSTSEDLKHWSHHGKCAGVNAKDRGFGYQEAPFVFKFGKWYWMLTDPHDGIAVFRSKDLKQWRQTSRILRDPGTHSSERTRARHPSAFVTKNGRGLIFYHVEPNRKYPTSPPAKRTIKQKKSCLQIAELKIENGSLNCDRDAEISGHPK